MSEENKNIDQLFSDAAQSEKAPNYEKAYWNEMNAMLNARDAKKKAFLLWALGGSAAFAILLFSLFALNMDDSMTEKRYASEKVNLEIEKTEFSDDANWINKKNENISNSHLENEHLSTNEIKESGLISNKETIANPNRNQISIQNNLNSDLKSKENALGYSEIANSKNQNNNLISQNEERNDIVKNESSFKENEVSENEELSDNRIDPKISLPYASIFQLEDNRNGNITPSELKYRNPAKYIIYAKLSGGLMENYKTSRPFESGLFDLSLNLEINMNSVLLRTGLGAQMTSNADLIVSQRKTINGTMVVQLQKDLSYQNLYDVYIPLELGYQLNNTSFGVGAQVNYLMTTSMELNNYENKMLVSTEKQYGNTDGLNSFSTQGYIWIEQKFTPMISLGLKTGTNISGRIKDGAYFNESSTTNPIYGQLSLRVNLLK